MSLVASNEGYSEKLTRANGKRKELSQRRDGLFGMTYSSKLFSSLKLAGITFPNRIVVSPMCEYSAVDGFASDWHLVHLGSRAVGGAGLIITEAAAVSPEGRITPNDLGFWKDEHVPAWKRIVDFLHSQGTRAGIQLAHAGRKASMSRPWEGPERVKPVSEGGWANVLAPSAVPFADHYAKPEAIDAAGIARLIQAFQDAARRALNAGFDVIEIHSEHGYLLHEFLSPLSNLRTDEYGGSLENRARPLIAVVDAVREVWPLDLPLFVRISATDWAEGGWDLNQSIALAKLLKPRGVDLIDVSSGGLVSTAKIPFGPGYQTEFAEEIREQAQIPTGAVGMITGTAQAEHILLTGQADLVFLAREMLRDPYWPLHAAQELHDVASWPPQYLRAAPAGSPERKSIIVE
jgi:2,4-dienoyl-CoA reductase-like NADH-dependent reductase (Old Yellow Enzyme family)